MVFFMQRNINSALWSFCPQFISAILIFMIARHLSFCLFTTCAIPMLSPRCKNKFGFRSCVTAWELRSAFSRDFDFEGKISNCFRSDDETRTKWRKKCFNYKTVLRFVIENLKAIKIAAALRFVASRYCSFSSHHLHSSFTLHLKRGI